MNGILGSTLQRLIIEYKVCVKKQGNDTLRLYPSPIEMKDKVCSNINEWNSRIDPSEIYDRIKKVFSTKQGN